MPEEGLYELTIVSKKMAALKPFRIKPGEK